MDHDRLIYPSAPLRLERTALLTEISKVEEGFSAFFHELYGDGTRVECFEDITVGWETQIVSFRLLPSEGESLDLIARIYSGQSGGWKAQWEFNVMHRLDAVGYPVPKVYAYESSGDTLGSPFLIMERIRGGVLWDVFFDGPREKYSDVLAINTRLMAQLHDISPAKLLPSVKRLKTRRRVLDRVQKEALDLEGHGLQGVFEPLIAWLVNNAETLIETPPCLIHLDFHPRNILLRLDGSPVVIDWATSTIGDFREDLCWTGLLAGAFIDEPLKQAIYDSYGDASPRVLVDLPYFEAFAGLRRLVDVAVTLKAGAMARGMRPEAIREMEGNRPHYANVLRVVKDATGVKLPQLTRLLGV